MKNTILLITFIIQLLLSYSNLNAQFYREKDWGVQIGISSELGTHIQNFGIKIQGYYNYQFVQANTGLNLRFNMLNIGGRSDFIETRFNIGVALMGGKRTAIPQFILDGLNHQTSYQYGIAYNYLWYLDNAGSSQSSAGFGLHIEQFSLLMENDLFIGKGSDRFRTSYLGINYHNQFYNLSIHTKLWTGDTRNTKLLNTPDSLYAYGYKDLRDKLYGRYSHGIISASVDYLIFWGNSISAEVGFDSERFRDILQNKMIHDKRFVPQKLRKPDPNYPMLNKEGLPIHNKKEARPPRVLFQAGLNRALTY
ncbi:MAG: polymorphic toxin type 23 domain-containing protein [Brumimicrobium sp.]|nr:polymorphic toxin type 23 domain-containing protein [Brumimicrobium sp.]